MIFPVFPWMYALLFVILVLAWPLYIPDYWLLWLCLVVNTSIFCAVVYFSSSRDLSFWRGLKLICASYESGCANITVVYIFPLLAVYYIRMIRATWIGVRTGKQFTEQWWIEKVSHRINSRWKNGTEPPDR